ncbi:MBL fold metallo-hydrolase [Saccharopolyspora sp. NFXS83]|uniref:MBL fold metallo-hydrolase n=1 Tax=Saccharopolyspora sp. NFXS83 TaxID=2993560 RepID=UPI00224A80F9|nr:MBL fold metallo-hydrolase [Saccharopolyspora sp. NFXS83]MCX2733823.1 MBL fold metallo-hydrolase [Saccharopolyspora sp. NFXS83]
MTRPAAEHADSDDHPARRVPGRWRATLGELTLTHIPDAGLHMIPPKVYPSTGEHDWHDEREHRTGDGLLTMGCGALLVERGSTRLLIDAGHGRIPADEVPDFADHFEHVQDLPGALANLGVVPADVDVVAFTHLHPDHTGWARPDATDDGRGLFPAARWLVGRGEWAEVEPGGDPALAGGADRVVTVDDGAEVVPGVRAWALPGHTPGHTAWVLDTGDGREVVAFGDALHSPAQVRHPDWEVLFDANRSAAERSRRRLVERLSGEGTLGFGMHFADQQLGRVEHGGWSPHGEPASG